MSKTTTVHEPAEIERFIAGASAQVLDDPDAVSRAIVHDILTAPTVDDVFRRRELTHARDVLGDTLTIVGVRWMQGDYDTDGPGFYAVVDAANTGGYPVPAWATDEPSAPDAGADPSAPPAAGDDPGAGDGTNAASGASSSGDGSSGCAVGARQPTRGAGAAIAGLLLFAAASARRRRSRH